MTRSALLRELAGLLLLLAGVVAQVAALAMIVAAGVWWLFALVVGAPVLLAAGRALMRWDPAEYDRRRMERAAERQRRELLRTDPDAVIRER